MIPFPIFRTIDDAWVGVLELAAKQNDGRILHAVLAISEPSVPDAHLVELNDQLIVRDESHSVMTVASTLFPSDMYDPPDVDFAPDMAPADRQLLDDAAAALFDDYRSMLPTLCEFAGNTSGTYFGRLVSWPGNTSNGFNQLGLRVEQLRKQRGSNRRSANAADMVVEGNAELDALGSDGLGLQIYKSTDKRPRGFPCLVHLDVSVVNSRISLMAVYRHWHLIHKAYGNLIGLTRLLHFLAQQTGYEPGELMIHGTVANAQFQDFGKGRVRDLSAATRKHLAVGDEKG